MAEHRGSIKGNWHTGNYMVGCFQAQNDNKKKTADVKMNKWEWTKPWRKTTASYYVTAERRSTKYKRGNLAARDVLRVPPWRNDCVWRNVGAAFCLPVLLFVAKVTEGDQWPLHYVASYYKSFTQSYYGNVATLADGRTSAFMQRAAGDSCSQPLNHRHWHMHEVCVTCNLACG